MPARKAARQSAKRYARNHSVRRATRTAVGHARRAIAAGDEAAAEPALRAALSALDRAARKGVLHKNNASRGKSRLAASFNRMREAAGS